jgi:hypothetical protein
MVGAGPNVATTVGVEAADIAVTLDDGRLVMCAISESRRWRSLNAGAGGVGLFLLTSH